MRLWHRSRRAKITHTSATDEEQEEEEVHRRKKRNRSAVGAASLAEERTKRVIASLN